MGFVGGSLTVTQKGFGHPHRTRVLFPSTSPRAARSTRVSTAAAAAGCFSSRVILHSEKNAI